MLIKDCKGCEHYMNLIALGLGARCRLPEHQFLQKASVDHKMLPILISRIHEECKHGYSE